jgi:hypothetical protein
MVRTTHMIRNRAAAPRPVKVIRIPAGRDLTHCRAMRSKVVGARERGSARVLGN